MLKGGLHCHTTRTDGEGTPEEVIRLHKDNGYDFLAITDHRLYNYKNFAPDTGITIIPGVEFDNIFYNEDILTLDWYLERYNENHKGILLFDIKELPL